MDFAWTVPDFGSSTNLLRSEQHACSGVVRISCVAYRDASACVYDILVYAYLDLDPLVLCIL